MNTQKKPINWPVVLITAAVLCTMPIVILLLTDSEEKTSTQVNNPSSVSNGTNSYPSDQNLPTATESTIVSDIESDQRMLSDDWTKVRLGMEPAIQMQLWENSSVGVLGRTHHDITRASAQVSLLTDEKGQVIQAKLTLLQLADPAFQKEHQEVTKLFLQQFFSGNDSNEGYQKFAIYLQDGLAQGMAGTVPERSINIDGKELTFIIHPEDRFMFIVVRKPSNSSSVY